MSLRKTIDQNMLSAPVEGRFAARLVEAASDLAWVIDADGVIRDVSAGLQPGSPRWHDLVGKRWSETVLPDSRAKVEALLADARNGDVARPREINQPVSEASAKVIPFRFSAASLDDQRVVAFGRDLSEVSKLQQEMLNAQQAMDREYSRLRQAEMRYRMLFQVSSEPVLVVDAATLHIVELNATAAAMFAGLERPQPRGLAELFEPASFKAIEALVAAVQSGGRAEPVDVTLLPHGEQSSVAMSLFRQGATSLLLVRILKRGAAPASDTPRSARLLAVLDSMPDAFVVTDSSMRILCANPAFCELVQQANESGVVGQPLGRWFGRSGVEASILASNLKEHGTVRNFATVVGGEEGGHQEAVVSAVAADDVERGQIFGLSFRVEPGRLAVIRAAADVQPRSVDQLQSLVGRVSLKEIVRESADLVERLCIEAALQLTSDNRASAAHLLGLSRQGLYSKLRRHGLEKADGRGAPPPERD